MNEITDALMMWNVRKTGLTPRHSEWDDAVQEARIARWRYAALPWKVQATAVRRRVIDYLRHWQHARSTGPARIRMVSLDAMIEVML